MTFTFGQKFKIHVFGESHGNCVGVIIEGCPPGFGIDLEAIQSDLDHRRPGQGKLTSARREMDSISVLSGLFDGMTTEAPLVMTIPNTDANSSHYDNLKDTPRPGTADYTARIKYNGKNDYRGSGVFSGRMTAALVAAGSVAKQLLAGAGIEVIAHVVQVGNVKIHTPATNQEIRSQTYANAVRCADHKISFEMAKEIARVKRQGDSIGGIIECRILGVPVGVGEPLFGSIESVVSQAMFAIPGAKGIEFGAGFSSAASQGSQNNDPLAIQNGKVILLKNDAGGILGGISNGQPIVFRLAFKPTPSIAGPQSTVNLETGQNTEIRIKGRHDPCIVPRAVPVVECLAAVVIADLVMRGTDKIEPPR